MTYKPTKRKRRNKNGKAASNKTDAKSNPAQIPNTSDSDTDESPDRKKQANVPLPNQDKDPDSKNKPKSRKIPPIIVPDTTIENVFTILNKLSITDFRLQKISIGIKIILDNVDNFNTLKNFLKTNGTSFYTFDLPDQKTTKIVIYGLSFISLELISEDLATKQASPVHARVIKPKANPNNQLYVLTFQRNSEALKNFKALKDICKIIFTWKPYVNKEKNFVQCHNCQMMGHGSRNCNCNSKCVRCGDSHKSADCPLKDADTNKISQDSVKCANCGSNHTANYSECPKRIEYINTQQKIRLKNSQKQSNDSKKQPIVQENISFSQIVKSSTNISPNVVSNVMKNIPEVRPTNNPNLFAHNEIMTLFTELIQRLHACTNKTEQLHVIVDVTSKYIFPDLDNDDF